MWFGIRKGIMRYACISLIFIGISSSALSQSLEDNVKAGISKACEYSSGAYDCICLQESSNMIMPFVVDLNERARLKKIQSAEQVSNHHSNELNKAERDLQFASQPSGSFGPLPDKEVQKRKANAEKWKIKNQKALEKLSAAKTEEYIITPDTLLTFDGNAFVYELAKQTQCLETEVLETIRTEMITACTEAGMTATEKTVSENCACFTDNLLASAVAWGSTSKYSSEKPPMEKLQILKRPSFMQDWFKDAENTCGSKITDRKSWSNYTRNDLKASLNRNGGSGSRSR